MALTLTLAGSALAGLGEMPPGYTSYRGLVVPETAVPNISPVAPKGFKPFSTPAPKPKIEAPAAPEPLLPSGRGLVRGTAQAIVTYAVINYGPKVARWLYRENNKIEAKKIQNGYYTNELHTPVYP